MNRLSSMPSVLALIAGAALAACTPMPPSGEPWRPVAQPPAAAPGPPTPNPGTGGVAPGTGPAAPGSPPHATGPRPPQASPAGPPPWGAPPDGPPPVGPRAPWVPGRHGPEAPPPVSPGGTPRLHLVSALVGLSPPRAVLELPDGHEVVVRAGQQLPEWSLVVVAIEPGALELALVRPEGGHATLEPLILHEP